MLGRVRFGPRVRVDVHFMATVEQPGDLAEDEGFGKDRKTSDEHRDAKRAAHFLTFKLIVWKTSA